MDTALPRGTAMHGIGIIVQLFVFLHFRQVHDLLLCE